MDNIDMKNCHLWDLTRDEINIIVKASQIARREKDNLDEWFKSNLKKVKA